MFFGVIMPGAFQRFISGSPPGAGRDEAQLVICNLSFVVAPMAGASGASAIRALDICAAIPASILDTPPAKTS
jgi:hypothetical protein